MAARFLRHGVAFLAWNEQCGHITGPGKVSHVRADQQTLLESMRRES